MRVHIPKPSSALRFAEYCLVALGCVLLVYSLTMEARRRIYQREQTQKFDVARASQAHPRREFPAIQAGILGRLQIPHIGLAAMVLEGSDESTLQLGIGHLEGTVPPGETGNVVLCAHRDTFFRDLQRIRRGDTIVFSSVDVVRTYRVDSTIVIDPSQTEVLDPSTRSMLTLITCYPFHYVGPAPKRFVVRATLLLDPTTAGPAEQSSGEGARPQDEV